MLRTKIIAALLAAVAVAITEAKSLTGKTPRKLMGKKDNAKDGDENMMVAEHKFANFVGVANRAGGTVSLVDPTEEEASLEYVMPDSGEPMYFGLSPFKNELWVADRANQQIVILKMKESTLVLDDTIPLPAGPFHAIITQTKETSMYPIMYTVCDIAKVVVACDVTTRRRLGVMAMPTFDEVQAEDVKPHDVTSNDEFVYVSFLVSSDANNIGYVAQYNISNHFELVQVLTTGPDPHVAIRDGTSLFIADQTAVSKVSASNINMIEEVTMEGAHGMFISLNSKYLYTTNIGGGGIDAVGVWDIETGRKKLCPPVDTEFPVPHNPTVTAEDLLVVTHSGPSATFNSVFEVGYDGCLNPNSRKSFETNTNPFGIITIPPPSSELICRRERNYN